mmetsp:Transcript_68137/g.163144  ORF Transcript_68137/g.163144 Transcript_68137/m.163144 type:complete len:310 (-) Transcript_68137:376-1305(-)
MPPHAHARPLLPGHLALCEVLRREQKFGHCLFVVDGCVEERRELLIRRVNGIVLGEAVPQAEPLLLLVRVPHNLHLHFCDEPRPLVRHSLLVEVRHHTRRRQHPRRARVLRAPAHADALADEEFPVGDWAEGCHAVRRTPSIDVCAEKAEVLDAAVLHLPCREALPGGEWVVVDMLGVSVLEIHQLVPLRRHEHQRLVRVGSALVAARFLHGRALVVELPLCRRELPHCPDSLDAMDVELLNNKRKLRERRHFLDVRHPHRPPVQHPLGRHEAVVDRVPRRAPEGDREAEFEEEECLRGLARDHGGEGR